MILIVDRDKKNIPKWIYVHTIDKKKKSLFLFLGFLLIFFSCFFFAVFIDFAVFSLS